MAETGKHKIIVFGVAIAIISVILLIMSSFGYLEYYEFGFKRQKSTGSVDKTEVYDVGRYFIGPDFEFKVFPADLQYIELKEAKIFTSDKLEVKVTATLQYVIRKEELVSLHDTYDLDYKEIMETSALDTLKGAITVYTTRELVNNRSNIEETVFKAIRERLGGTCCNKYCGRENPQCSTCLTECTDADRGLHVQVKYFQLGKIDIPYSVEIRYIEALVLQEQTEEEQLKQESVIVRKETSQQVQVIKNEAVEISQNATAQAELINSISNSNYTVVLETARSEGLKTVFANIGLSQQEHKNSYDYLRTIRGQEKTHLTIDYQQRIAGNL